MEGWSQGDRFLIIKENDYFVHLSNKAHSCVSALAPARALFAIVRLIT